MTLAANILLAVALSIDAMVCCIILGRRNYSRANRIKIGLQVSFAFGLFQFLMPVAGFLAGTGVQNFISSFDHWVAFALLFIVSANMVKEAFFGEEDESEKVKIAFLTLLSLSIATSIDALAVGVSIGLIQDTILGPALIIGVICFTISLLSFMVGQLLSGLSRHSRWLNLFAAAVLLGIGLNILHAHNVF